MKKICILYVIIFCLSVLVMIANLTKENANSNSPDNRETTTNCITSNIENEYQYFNECGFAIKAPCLLKDVSQHSSGEFFLNYGGTINEDNPDKMVAYQVIVNRLPIGYKDLSQQQLDNLVNELMKKAMKGSNSKPIKFSYDEYPGYAMECTTMGYAQKGVMFWKDSFIICLTVITNDRLNEKFNKFTNSFKNIESSNVKTKSSQDLRMQPIQEIGYSLYIPCDLRKSQMQGFDIYYDGAINGESQAKAIVYKIMANKLPQPYSQMIAYDRETIKQNLINYLQSKESYQKWETPINSHMSYIANSTEQGFKIKEVLILNEHMVINLVMFSKLNIELKFKEFINSIEPIK